MRKKLVIGLIVVITIVGASIYYYNQSLKPLNINGQEKLVTIEPGYSLKEISTLLEESEVIKNRYTFQIYTLKNDLADSIKAGKYLLNANLDVLEIANILAEGNTIDESVVITIPEGYTLNQISELFEKNNLTTQEKFMEEASNIEKYREDFIFLSSIENLEDRNLEGYLFPDTYYFNQDESLESKFRKMLGRFGEIFRENYRVRAEELDMTVDEIVVLSSIVEQETKYDEDRPKVAGVFYNRLDKGMHLQSDVTVLYAMGIKKEQVLYKDLEIDSEYNTYQYPGLPAGPIGSFSKESLTASLYPEEHEYMYFIAKEDGHCLFNETYEEHMADVDKYLR